MQNNIGGSLLDAGVAHNRLTGYASLLKYVHTNMFSEKFN